MTFTELSAAEASAWLGAGHRPPRAPVTLAELYALRGDVAATTRPDVRRPRDGLYL